MSNGWWEKKLGTPAVRLPDVQQQPYVPPTINVGQQSTPPVQQNHIPTPRCPGCGSSNYGGTAESRPRCYDCGYPIQQSGSGVVGVQMPQAQGPTQASKQVSTSNNFNPQGIIGRL